MKQQLHVTEGPDQGLRIELLDGQTLTVGRGQASDVRLNDPRVSRIHVRLQVDQGTVVVQDAGSSSGTQVNGGAIEQHTLRPGDVIQIGDTKLRYQLEGAREESTLVDSAFGRPKPPPKVVPLEQLIGQSFSHFQIDSIVARGSSGMVFRARDTHKDRVVALKVLSPDYSGTDEQKERFVRGVKTMGPIKHDHIASLYAAGRPLPNGRATAQRPAPRGQVPRDGIRTVRVRNIMSLNRIPMALLLGIAVTAICGNLETRAAERPNIVLIFADDLGYADVGCFGAKDIQTPNIDKLADEGTRFTSFYVAQPVCTASRAALMTGCYSHRVSMAGALNHTSKVGINADELLLPEILKQRGYATAIFGKWHLGLQPEFSPLRHGFNEFVGIPYSNDNGPLHPVVRDIPPLPWFNNDKVVEEDPDQSQFTRRLTERAVRCIEQNKNQPFFLYVPHIMPHVPIFASPPFRGQSARGLYGDVVEELDWSVGEIVAALKRSKLEDNTLVIFTSDNGPFLSYGNHAGSAKPLREGKLTTFEGGVRVPCVMRWPGKIAAGRTCHEMLSTIDLLPTIAKLIDAPRSKLPIDGVDVWPLIAGNADAKSPRQTFLYYSGDELQAIRHGDWKLHLPHDYLTVAGPPGRGGKPANFENMKPKSIEESGIRGIASRHGYEVRGIELSLFNLTSDVGETRNVAAEHPDLVARLQRLANDARAELGDSLTMRRGAGIRPSGRAD